MTTRFLFYKLTFLILLAFNLPLNAQMSGTYTLGSALSDYESFTDAVNDLRVQGLAGDVEFRVKPDTYHNVTVDNVPNDSSYHILFVYDGTPGDSAVIAGQLKVINTTRVTFKGFTILPRESQRTSCVISELSDYFTLDSCRVLNLYNCDFDYDEGLLKLDFPWEGAYLVAYIRNCKIRSGERTFYYGGKKGSVWIEGNTITGTIVNEGNQNSLFSIKFHYYDNIFYCTSDNFKQAGQEFHNNTFYFESIFDLEIQGDLYYNRFFTDVDISAGDVIGNEFYDFAEMKWCNNAKVYGNQMHGRFRTIYSHGIKIANNTFFKSVRLTNDNTSFWNNLAYDSVTFTQGPGQFVFNNNFRKTALLTLIWTSGKLINNNLGKLFIQPGQIDSWTIEDNNFINPGGGVCCVGDRPHYYAPFYDSALRTGNPLLIGKGGNFYPRFKYDIDSTERKKPCTIGANEICFSWQVHSLELSCSDSIQLDLCTDTLINSYWSPAYLFDDTLSPNPKIYPDSEVTVYLKTPEGEVIDSLSISPEAAAPVAKADFQIHLLEVSFQNESRCADAYVWDFGDGTSSTEESPVHHYAEARNYTCSLTATNDLGEDELTLNILLTDVGDNKYSDSFGFYPNPAKERFTIVWEKEFNTVKIFTIQGKAVMYKTFDGVKRLNVDTDRLAPGIYFVAVKSSEGEIRTGKCVVRK